MRVIFCGTPDFALPTLKKLLDGGFSINLVITNPDAPAGRGYDLKPSPVKSTAKEAGLEVFQPAKLKDPATQAHLTQFHPDAIVVVAYGHILPQWMIDLPRVGCVNLHASLLPNYRGAAPIQWALIHGERTTGVTTTKIDPGLDTGDILLQREVDIRDDDTTLTLSERLSTLGADLMVETVRGLERGEIAPRPQDHRRATLAPMLKKEDGRIDWKLTAEAISWRVRGLAPWPGAYTSFRKKTLHVWCARPAPSSPASGLEPGTWVVDRGTLSVVCGGGTRLEVKELQVEGRSRMPARDFLNGVRLAPGEKFG